MELLDRDTHSSGLGDFLYIRQIVQNMQTDEVVLHGLRMRRNSQLHALLKHSRNEVCLVLDVRVEDKRHFSTAATAYVSPDEVVGRRRVVFTPLPYPDLSAPWPRDIHTDHLVCRWVWMSVWTEDAVGRNGKPMKGKKSRQGILRRLSKRDVEEINTIRSVEKSQRIGRECKSIDLTGEGSDTHNPERRTSGSLRTLATPRAGPKPTHAALSEVTEFEQRITHISSAGTHERHMSTRYRETFTPAGVRLDNDQPSLALKSTRQSGGLVAVSAAPRVGSSSKKPKLTFGDVCCGAGGASHAAKKAGLDIKWAIDSDTTACETYIRNFPGTTVHHARAEELHAFSEDLHVDILHVSLPCPTWSAAHTVPGPNDDANSALLFAIGPILKKVKPRLCTLEQTSGLLQRHLEFFHAHIGMIAAEGYAVSWKIVSFADYGLVSPRPRLILFASA